MTAAFERASRLALVSSLATISVLQLAFHPDLTPGLRRASIAAFVAGLLFARLPFGIGIGVWVALAPVAPALLRAVTGREGPLLDVVWMVGLTGALLRASGRRGWQLPRSWCLPLGAWALVLTVAWPIVAARELNFDWRTLNNIGAVNSWAMLTAGSTVAWTLYIVQTQLLALLWFDWVAGELARKPTHTPHVLHALWIGATAASVVALYQGAVDLTFLSTRFWANERRATGTLLDANGYGMLAALAAPVGLFWLRASGRLQLGVVILVINWLGFWMSGSRTAFVAVVAGAIGLAAAVLLTGRRAEWRPARAVALIAAFVAVAAVAILVGSAVGPVRRIAAMPLSRAGLVDLWNRGGYGTIALRMVRETPWTGVGPGMYHVIAPDYWRVMHQMTLAFDNAQNWWRHQVAELGVLGALPVVGWSMWLALGLLIGPPREGRSDGWLPRLLLLGLGAASLLGIPTQSPVVLLWFFALAAWWAAASRGVVAEGRVSPALARPMTAALLVLVIAYAFGTAMLARGWLSVPERARRANREYVVGAYEPEPLAGATWFRWTAGDARLWWPAPTRGALLRLWVGHPDVEQAPVHVTVTTACQVLFDEDLPSTTPVDLGLELAEDSRELELRIATSRTWQAPDGRQLGAAVLVDPRGASEARSQARFARLDTCPRP